MDNKDLDTLLQLLVCLQEVKTTPDIPRIAKSLFTQLSKYRFSSSENLPTIKA